jgi:uncharacterized membrane protein
MALKLLQVINIMLFAFLAGMYISPWLALTKSLSSFEPNAFLPIVKQLSRNMGPLMTALTPIALLSAIPVLVLSFGSKPTLFYLVLVALLLFIVTLAVTMLIEVPIVAKINTRTVAELPRDWEQLRDNWVSFHLLRIVPGVIGLALTVIAAIF